AAAWQARRRAGGLHVPAELGQALPRTAGARGRAGRGGPRRRALDPHRGRHHRPALGDAGLMASAESVAAVIEAGGAHVPELMERLEARLAELARSHGPVLAEHAGSTIAAGGKRLRPLLVFVAAGPEPANRDLVLRAAVSVELVH